MKVFLALSILLLAGGSVGNKLHQLLLVLQRELNDVLENPAERVCGQQGDVVILVDASSSIGSEDYKTAKNFVKNLISGFNVSADGVRIGLVAFNRFPNITFQLNKIVNLAQENSPTTLEDLVDNMAPTEVGTFTDRGLKVIREEMFTEENGDRPDIPNIVVVVTDGRSRKPEETKMEAELLRETGAYVFAVAVGTWAKEEELEILASKPVDKYKFSVDDFRSLNSIKTKLLEKTCKVLDELPPQFPVCGQQGDVVILVDASSSIGSEDYKTAKNFVKRLISGFNVSADGVRIGLVAFNRFPNITFQLNKIVNLAQENSPTTLEDLVDNLAPTEVGTFTDRGLKVIREEMFTEENGDRPDIPNIVVVVTDGRSRKPEETKMEAALLRQTGTYMFAVAVGTWAKEEELEILASKPVDKYKFSVDDFRSLNSIKAKLVHKTCKVLDELPPQIPDCIGKIDLLFIIDGSTSITNENFWTAKKFISDLLSSFVISPEYVRVAALTFDQWPRIVFYLDSFSSAEAVKDAVLEAEQVQQGTLTDRALLTARMDIFNVLNGDRLSVPNVIVLFSDGRSRRPEETLKQASMTREGGATIITVDIGNKTVNELYQVASVNDNQNPLTFSVDDFDALKQITTNLVEETCKVPRVPLKVCKRKLDLMFVLDFSRSVEGEENLLKSFVVNMAETYEMVNASAQIGVIAFNTVPRFALKLFEGTDVEAVKEGVAQIAKPDNGTMTWRALDMLREQAFVDTAGLRPDSDKVAIVITAGISKTPQKTIKAANELRASGVTVFSIAVSKHGLSQKRLAEVDAMAGSLTPDNEKFKYKVKTFGRMFSLIPQLVKATCTEPTPAKDDLPKRALELLAELESIVKQLENLRCFA